MEIRTRQTNLDIVQKQLHPKPRKDAILMVIMYLSAYIGTATTIFECDFIEERNIKN